MEEPVVRYMSLKLIRYKYKPTLFTPDSTVNATRLLNLFVGGTWAAAKDD